MTIIGEVGVRVVGETDQLGPQTSRAIERGIGQGAPRIGRQLADSIDRPLKNSSGKFTRQLGADAPKAGRAIADGVDGPLKASAGRFGRQMSAEGAPAGGRFGRGFGNSFSQTARRLAGGLAAIFAVSKISQFVRSTLGEAAESNKVGRLTAQVIKSTGGAARVTAVQVNALATAISNKTGIDDEAIQSASNLLLTFTKVRNQVGRGNDVFNQATLAATNMAVALGEPPKNAALQLGKALNDPVKGITALSRAGVSFTAQQKAQIAALVASGHSLQAQKIILRELNTEFGGAAAATSTPLQKLRVNVDNLKEQIGNALLPAFNLAATFLIGRVIPNISTGVSRIEALVPRVRAFVNTFVQGFRGGDIAGATNNVARFGAIAGAVFNAITGRAQALVGGLHLAFGGNLLGPLLAGVAGAGPVVLGLLNHFGRLGPVLGIVKGAVGGVSAAVQGLGGAFRFLTSGAGIWLTIAGLLAAVLIRLFQTNKPFHDSVVKLFGVLQQVGATLATALMPVLSALGAAFTQLAPVIGQIVTQLVGALAPVLTTIVGVVAQLLPPIAQLVVSLISALLPAFNAIIGAVLPLVSTLVGVLAPILTQLLGILAPLITVLANALAPVLVALAPLFQIIGQLLAAVLGPALQLVAALLVPLVQLLGVILVPVIKLLAAVLTPVIRLLGVGLTAAINFVVALVSGKIPAVNAVFTSTFNAVKTVVMAVFNFLKPFITAYITVISAVIRAALAVIKFVWTNVWNGVRTVITVVWPIIRAVVSTAVASVVAVIARIRAVVSIVSAAFSAVRSAITGPLNAVVSFVSGIVSRIVGLFRGLGGALRGVGSDIVNGLRDGFTAAWDRFLGYVKGLVNKLPAIAKKALGISSPSRVFAAIGEQIGAGLTLGMTRSRGRVLAAGRALVSLPIGAPSGVTQTSTSGTVPAGGAGVTNYIYGAPGMSVEELAAITSRRTAFDLKLGVVRPRVVVTGGAA